MNLEQNARMKTEYKVPEFRTLNTKCSILSSILGQAPRPPGSHLFAKHEDSVVEIEGLEELGALAPYFVDQ